MKIWRVFLRLTYSHLFKLILALSVFSVFVFLVKQPHSVFPVSMPLPLLGTSRNITSHLVKSSSDSPLGHQCRDVLRNMLRGRWIQRKMTSEEIERMRVFHQRVREVEHHIPKGVQRPDKRCGNVNVGVGGMLHFFKGLCDPHGDTPCCYNFTCQNKTIEQCTCPNCEDMRTPIQAEYATWRPDDASCQPRKWTKDEICRLLGNSTIHFIGDSLVRHVFTAFLLAIRGNVETGAFRATIPDNLRPWCSGLYMFSEKVCRLWLDEQTTMCNGSVTLTNFHLILARQVDGIHNAVLSLRNVSRSLVFMGIGFHDKFSAPLIKNKVLLPLLETMQSQNLTRPHLLWANVHQFGMMRTPLTTEDNEAVKAFNRDVKELLDRFNVSVFDTYDFPHNVMSFDGQHYGYGVNSMKVNILMHYIEELKAKGQW